MATVTPMIEPNQDAMRAHLEHLFGGDIGGAHDGRIEIAWTDAADGKLRHGAIFGTDQIEEAIDHAVMVNRVPQQNVYVGAALRNPGVAPFGRGADIDFYALTALYVDIDDDVLAQARDHYRHRGCPPTAVVVTGRQPHVRAQLLWRLDEPERDPQATRAQLKALADALGGDVTVVNPSRVLRLAGSIAWPVKPGRVLEHTEWQQPDDGRPKAYLWGQIARAFPVATQASLDAGLTSSQSEPDRSRIGAGGLNLDLGVRVDDYLTAARTGRQWHNHVLGLVAHWVSRGWSDSEILGQAAGLTLAGYTVAQTVADMRKMIAGARAKWNIPDPEPKVDEPGEAAQPDAEVFSAADLTGDPPPREWLIDEWMPRKAVTILYGDGGTGKTLIAQQLATCMALGQPWLGLPVTHGKVFAVFCEDDRDEIHRRQHAINDHYGVTLRAPLAAFSIVSRFGHPNQLVAPDAKGRLTTTPFYDWLVAQIADRRPDLTIIDTVADTFGGNENSRPDVTMFLKAVLGRLVTQFGTTVLALAHPSLTGLATGSGMSGNTAWNNSVRSRWYFERPKDGDKDTRILTKKKANYSAAGDDEAVEAVWQNGVIEVPQTSEQMERLKQQGLKRDIVNAIGRAWEEDRPYQKIGQRSVYKALPRHLNKPANEVARALNDLIGDGEIVQLRTHHKHGYTPHSATVSMHEND